MKKYICGVSSSGKMLYATSRHGKNKPNVLCGTYSDRLFSSYLCQNILDIPLDDNAPFIRICYENTPNKPFYVPYLYIIVKTKNVCIEPFIDLSNPLHQAQQTHTAMAKGAIADHPTIQHEGTILLHSLKHLTSEGRKIVTSPQIILPKYFSGAIEELKYMKEGLGFQLVSLYSQQDEDDDEEIEQISFYHKGS